MRPISSPARQFRSTADFRSWDRLAGSLATESPGRSRGAFRVRTPAEISILRRQGLPRELVVKADTEHVVPVLETLRQGCNSSRHVRWESKSAFDCRGRHRGIRPQPAANLGHSLSPNADPSRLSAPITDRQHVDLMAFAARTSRTAALVTHDPLQQRPAQKLAGDRQHL
jgi:hypothetical protein